MSNTVYLISPITINDVDDDVGDDDDDDDVLTTANCPILCSIHLTLLMEMLCCLLHRTFITRFFLKLSLSQ